MHLDGCIHPNEESDLSRDIIDQVFSLRTSRILNGIYGADTSSGVAIGYCNCFRQYNSRYRALTSLKRRVWQRFGWTAPPPVYGLQDPKDRSSRTEGLSETEDSPIFDTLIPIHNHEIEDGSIASLWDGFAATASDNILDWDEWDSLLAFSRT
jgi:hypothetical protein